MEKSKVWLIIGLIVIVSALVLRIASPRNRWVCERGEWRAQGSPRTAQPNKLCVDNLSIDAELQALAEILQAEPLNNSNIEAAINEVDVAGHKNDVMSIDDAVKLNPEINNDLLADANMPQEESLVAPSSENSLQLISPQPGELLRSPYLISGRVWAQYFTESELIVTLQNEAKEIISEYTFELSDINSDTDGWFNFQTELIFDASKGKKGVLLIKKKRISQKSIGELLLSRSIYLAP